VDTEWFVALDEEDLVSVARDQLPDLFVGRSPEHRRARDLVAIQVEDGQDRAIPRWVQKADPLPASLERPSLGLAVADHRGNDEARVVEGGSEGMDQNVAELPTLVDRPRRGHAHVARDPARGRELSEESPQPVLVLRHLGVDLGVRPFEVDVGDDRRATVPWAGQIDNIGVVLRDEAVQVDV
jgi:hypothetical protein